METPGSPEAEEPLLCLPPHPFYVMVQNGSYHQIQEELRQSEEYTRPLKGWIPGFSAMRPRATHLAFLLPVLSKALWIEQVYLPNA